MALLQTPQLFLATLEKGETLDAFQDAINTTLIQLQRRAERGKAAKGSVTLTLHFEVTGDDFRTVPEIAAKTPKESRRATLLFLTEDGVPSTEHPAQPSLQFTPRSVGDRETA
jgi:hypothetical protein